MRCLVSDACPWTVVAAVGTPVSLAVEIPQPAEEPDSLPRPGSLQVCRVLQDGFEVAASKGVLTDAEGLRAGEGRRGHRATLSSCAGPGLHIPGSRSSGACSDTAPGAGLPCHRDVWLLMFFILSQYLFPWFKKNDK